jgi:hypothetical protein
MNAKPNTGLEPRARVEASPKKRTNDDSRCYVCGGHADGFDALGGGPLCKRCDTQYDAVVKRALGTGAVQA